MWSLVPCTDGNAMTLLFDVAHISGGNSLVNQSAAAPGTHVIESKGVCCDPSSLDNS